MNDTVIETQRLSKKFTIGTAERLTLFSSLRHKFSGGEVTRDIWALKDIDISIQRGEMVAILGLNGSGKSTLLRILAGIMQQTAGTFTVNGEVSCLFELGLGFNPKFTALQNIYLYGALHGLSRREIDRILPDIIEFSELENFIGARLSELSSGMKARLAFATVIQVIHGIIMVDEILSVGDAPFQRKCMSAFRKLLDDGNTILFVSHGISDDIRKICGKALYLDKGSQIDFGPLARIEQLYADRVNALPYKRSL